MNDKKRSILDLDHITENTTLERFKSENIEIKQGDSLRWTKTDKDRGIVAHECIKVDQIVGDKISVINEKSKKYVIDMSLNQNQHIDYSYSSTIHGLQGRDL